MKLLKVLIVLVLLNGCSQSNSNDSEEPTKPNTTYKMEMKEDIVTDLNNMDVQFYNNVSTNTYIVFNLLSSIDLMNENVELTVQCGVPCEIQLNKSELEVMELKDFAITKEFDWKAFAIDYFSDDLEDQKRAHESINVFDAEFETIVENLENVPYAYTALLSFDNSNEGFINEITVYVDGESYVFDIGKITFSNAPNHFSDALETPLRGNVGSVVYPTKLKEYTDNFGLDEYDFTAHESLTLEKVVPTDDSLEIVDLKIRMNREGREYTQQLQNLDDIGYEIKKGDQFSLIISYASIEESNEVSYSQTYNSIVSFAGWDKPIDVVQESGGVIRTTTSIAEMLSDSQDGYQNYYFDYVEPDNKANQ